MSAVHIYRHWAYAIGHASRVAASSGRRMRVRRGRTFTGYVWMVTEVGA